MDIELKKEIYNVFKISEDKIMELMSIVEKNEILKARVIMDDIICEYKNNNSLEKLIFTEDNIINHNIIVEQTKKMESLYTDLMVYLEESELIKI